MSLNGLVENLSCSSPILWAIALQLEFANLRTQWCFAQIVFFLKWIQKKSLSKI